MTPALMLLPALLGAICLLPPAGSAAARRFVGAATIGGILVGLAVFFSRDSGETWRTARVDPSAAAIVAIAIVCAWILVWAVHRDDGWFQGALTGAASTALLLAAANLWFVPLLMFWVASSIAIGTLLLREERRSSVWLGLFASDAAWIAAVILHALDAETWRFVLPVEDKTLWLVLAALVLRAGVLLRAGVWAALSRGSAASVPLIVAGAFVILARVQTPVHAGISVGLLVVAVLTCSWAALKRPGDVASVPAWISALMLSACFVAPEVTVRAGIAAVLTATAAALWEWSSSGARVWRAVLLGATPLTAAFGVIVAAALAAFERAAAAREVIDAAPWTAIGALLPLAVGLGVVMSVRVARLREPAIHPGWATVATWALFAVSVVVGILPGAEIGILGPLTGATLRALVLHIGALLTAAVVGWLVYRRNSGVITQHAPGTARSEALVPRRPVSVVLTGTALVFLGVSVAATGWLTLRGLLVGFL